ncbi:MAG: hypothetical protein ABI446_11325 [Gemmatimonadaceae bacterium]
MSEVTASVLSLAGFALAEAVRRVCDVGAGVALTPFTIEDRAEGRVLTEDVRETTGATSDEWAFAHESASHDGIVVDFRAPGMANAATIVQRYERATSTVRAQLVGSPDIAAYDEPLDPNQQVLVLERVESGVRDHPESERLWRYWT